MYMAALQFLARYKQSHLMLWGGEPHRTHCGNTTGFLIANCFYAIRTLYLVCIFDQLIRLARKVRQFTGVSSSVCQSSWFTSSRGIRATVLVCPYQLLMAISTHLDNIIYPMIFPVLWIKADSVFWTSLDAPQKPQQSRCHWPVTRDNDRKNNCGFWRFVADSPSSANCDWIRPENCLFALVLGCYQYYYLGLGVA